MTETRYVPDANCLIDHLNKIIDLTAFLHGVEGETTEEVARCDVSVVAALEALSKPGMTKDELWEAEVFLSQFPEEGITTPIKKEAAAIRRAAKIGLPDAVIAATAVRLGAVLLTRDDRLIRLKWPGLSVQSILHIPKP